MTKNGWIQWLVEQLREFGPYFAVELLLPGGTLVALALWVYRNREALWHRVGTRVGAWR
jgi:hypothetical protein